MLEPMQSVEELVAGLLAIVREIDEDDVYTLPPEVAYALHFYVYEAARLGLDEMSA